MPLLTPKWGVVQWALGRGEPTDVAEAFWVAVMRRGVFPTVTLTGGDMNVAIAVILAMFVAGCGGPNLSVSVRAGSSAAATAVASKALVAGTGDGQEDT